MVYGIKIGPHPEERAQPASRRTHGLDPADHAAACRLLDVLVSALALIALALTAWGAVTPGHF